MICPSLNAAQRCGMRSTIAIVLKDNGNSLITISSMESLKSMLEREALFHMCSYM